VARGGQDKIEVYGDSATVCGGKGPDGVGAFPSSGGHGRFLGNRGQDCLGKTGCTKDSTSTIGSRCSDYSATVELDGGPGPDVMWGGNRGDTLHGSGGPDDVYGCPGDDRALGGGGDDYVFGREGDDRLKGGAGTDLALGGAGHDHCEAESKRGCET
jgi:Ca2+-binding RTX toxin-like protein